MIQSTEDAQDFDAEARTFTVVRNGKRIKLTFAELFAAGHRVWMKGDFSMAKQIFQQLADVSGNIPRAHIFLAHCLVMEGDYSGCSSEMPP